MKIDQLRKATGPQPFKPFTLNMVDGRQFNVAHPELLHVFPGVERAVSLAFPEDDTFEIIDVPHIASLTVIEDDGRSKGRKKAG